MTHNEALDELNQRYPNKMFIGKKDLAKLTDRSLSALDRDIKQGVCVSFKKVRGRVLYPLHEVATWMSDLVKTL